MDAIRKQLDVLMGANRNGDVQEVNRKYYDRDVCRLYLSGLCPHDLFQLTKMDMGPCPKVHSLQLRKEYREARAKGVDNYDRELEDAIDRLIVECDRKIGRALKRLQEEDAKAAIAISVSEVTQSPEILELSEKIKEKMKEADLHDLEGKMDLKIRALELVEEMRTKRADQQAVLLLEAFNKDRASLPQPVPAQPPTSALPPPDPRTQGKKLESSTIMASETNHQFCPLHFVMFPFMAQGHMIPMVDISRLLAQRGVTITIVTTPHNAGRFKNVLSRAIESGLPIKIVQVKFPSNESGSSEGHESLDSLDSFDFETTVSFFEAINMLEEPVEKLLKEIQPRPSCVIADVCLPYTSRIVKKLGIPKIIFHPYSCFELLVTHIMFQNMEFLETIKSVKEYFPIPNFPDRSEFTKAQIPDILATGEAKEFIDTMVEADNSSYGVIMNTFEELETVYIRDYKKARGGKAWSVGPVSLCNKVEEDKAERGDKASIDQEECVKWLHSKEEGSVLYVCLGSICNLPLSQLKEIGLGLEESQRPFIWVNRVWEKNKELVEWISESGFKERIKERGLLIMGWAPQMIILSHPAIGGFLTHCGWNSTLEGITSYVPLLTWPLFGDQFCNQKLVVEILNVGVSAGVEDPMQWGEEEKIGILVDKEGVKKAVEELMGDSNDAKERRKRVKELGELAHKVVEQGGSSHSNITSLLQDIMQLEKSKK